MLFSDSFKRFVARIYYGSAVENLRRANHNAAKQSIRNAMALDPEGNINAFYLSCLGQCHLHLREYNDAVRVLTWAMSRMDEEKELWSQGSLKKEYERVEKALQISKRHWGRGILGSLADHHEPIP